MVDFIPTTGYLSQRPPRPLWVRVGPSPDPVHLFHKVSHLACHVIGGSNLLHFILAHHIALDIRRAPHVRAEVSPKVTRPTLTTYEIVCSKGYDEETKNMVKDLVIAAVGQVTQ